ncbi:MAG TPA: hemolysin family protein [Thermomicrobiales bacterium]|nr:hemolysin family protein [Thermomicrobiales bacterium]
MIVESGSWLALLGALIALLLLATAAVVETVVNRSSRSRVQAALGHVPETSGRQRARDINDPRHGLSAAMDLAQVLAAIIMASLLTYVFDQAFVPDIDWLAIVATIVIYLLVGQIVPRAIGEKEFEPHVDRIIGFGRTISIVFAPIIWIIDTGVRQVKRLLPGATAEQETEEISEVRSPSRSTYMDDVGDVERQMIEGILGLESMSVRDIMVPRLDIVAVERSVAADDLIETITRAGHSRIPVYQESVDRILGVLYAKDLLPFVIGTTRRIPLLDLIRPAFVVPESKKVSDLFAELKRARIHIAIVADEYGGTAGLVTIEDILEEIVGEIQDEYDSEQPLFEQVADDVLLADGRLPIEDVEDALDIRFEEDDDFGTLGGFVHKHLGRLPIQGDTFEAEGVRVEIIKVERHRIRRLRITRLRQDQEETPEQLPEVAVSTESDADDERT